MKDSPNRRLGRGTWHVTGSPKFSRHLSAQFRKDPKQGTAIVANIKAHNRNERWVQDSWADVEKRRSRLKQIRAVMQRINKATLDPQPEHGV